MNMRTSRKSGFTLVEIMIVAGIIGLMAVIAVPSYVRANSSSQKNACINNLYQIRCAIHQWALETKAPSGGAVQFTDISVYLRNTVSCPAGGTNFSDSYTITDTLTQPVCKKVPTGISAHILPPDITQ
jgi:prepilin-type N-terminal cleavage/methylation domain-containing protein